MNLTAQGITINQSTTKIVITLVHPGVSVKMSNLIVHQGLPEFDPRLRSEWSGGGGSESL